METSTYSFLNRKEVFIYPVRFYPTLKYGQTRKNSGETSVNIEFQKFAMFDYNLILIPIHKTSTDHWALAVNILFFSHPKFCNLILYFNF